MNSRLLIIVLIGGVLFSCKVTADKVLKNSGKDCWTPCNKQQGQCEYCGNGLCCRKGWGDRSKGCDGSIGGEGYHSCVDSGPWILGESGETCNQVCSKMGRYCNDEKQSALISNQLVAEKMAEAGYKCKGFHGARDYPGTPFSTGRNDDCAPLIPGSKAVCDGNQNPGHRALCYCDEGSTSPPPSASDPVQCNTENEGNCECGDTSKGFTTYTFMLGEVQRCFTVFHPMSRIGEKLPVVLSPNCYAKDKLRRIQMTDDLKGDNAAATKYGFSRIGLSTPDGGWTFGNDNIVNDQKPMPCSEHDSKDISYLKKIFEFIEGNPDKFMINKIYAEGFSQNSMFSAYTAFCFNDKVLGVWQGGSGLTLTGERPFVPKQEAQCSASSFEEHGPSCRTQDPCTTCQYWPIYPCYSETRSMVDCVMEYINDRVSVQEGKSSSKHMYDKLVNEGHDARLLRFDASVDGSIQGEHKNPQNKAHWYVGCLGIKDSCSSECEASFASCMNTKDQSTALKKARSFEECMEDSEDLAGCTGDCAPTYDMLIHSEIPTEHSFSKGLFGASTGSHISKPATSRCTAEDEA